MLYRRLSIMPFLVLNPISMGLVMADNANQAPIQVLDDVEVTASKSYDLTNWVTSDSTNSKTEQEKTTLGALTKSTSLAGSVIDQEELQTVKYVDIVRDQLSRIPGVSMVRNLRIPDGSKSYTNNLIDGMMVGSPQNGQFTFLDQFNPTQIERIDVIRGPGSVLYPSNGVGGAFNLITKNPSKTPTYMLSQELATYGFYRTQGTASGSS